MGFNAIKTRYRPLILINEINRGSLQKYAHIGHAAHLQRNLSRVYNGNLNAGVSLVPMLHRFGTDTGTSLKVLGKNPEKGNVVFTSVCDNSVQFLRKTTNQPSKVDSDKCHLSVCNVDVNSRFYAASISCDKCTKLSKYFNNIFQNVGKHWLFDTLPYLRRCFHANVIPAVKVYYYNQTASFSIHTCNYSTCRIILSLQKTAKSNTSQRDTPQTHIKLRYSPSCPQYVFYPLCTQTRSAHTMSKNIRGFKEEEKELPELNPDDLEESLVLGSGPGGQAVNKTHNAVMVKHIPTGIVVKSHITRSVETNRRHAHLELRHKLDARINGENSYRARKAREISQKKAKKRQRTNEKLTKLREFKEREGLK